jgi:hypothetical protein
MWTEKNLWYIYFICLMSCHITIASQITANPKPRGHLTNESKIRTITKAIATRNLIAVSNFMANYPKIINP